MTHRLPPHARLAIAAAVYEHARLFHRTPARAAAPPPWSALPAQERRTYLRLVQRWCAGAAAAELVPGWVARGPVRRAIYAIALRELLSGSTEAYEGVPAPDLDARRRSFTRAREQAALPRRDGTRARITLGDLRRLLEVVAAQHGIIEGLRGEVHLLERKLGGPLVHAE